jgi:hypothetical protein
MKSQIRELEQFYWNTKKPLQWLTKTEKGIYMPSKPDILFQASKSREFGPFFSKLNKNNILLDAGSGDGLSTVFFGFFKTNIIAIEYDKRLHDFSKTFLDLVNNKFKIKAKIQFICDDFLNFDLKKADLMYYYEEDNNNFETLANKFRSEAKEGTLMLVLHDPTHKKADLDRIGYLEIPPEYFFSLYRK